ncbi:MAG: amidohydrolase family protein [Fimbriimonadaceae bacterium]|nr:amidohydrolase family protein [Fimbriimonadaceae bacterium]
MFASVTALAWVSAPILSPPTAPVTAYVNATIYPISGPRLERATLVIEGNKIVAVGADVAVPSGATTVDASGTVILPGLVDTHSHVGDGNGADSSGPIQPDARIYDAINVRSPEFRRALAGGITTLNIMPGSGHLMSGQTLYAKNRRARTVEDLFIRDTDGWIFGGLKMANGTNPIGDPPFPGTRGKAMALVRERFLEAQEYAEKWKAYEAKRAKGEKVDAPSRNIGLDAMAEALSGRRIVQHHTHRADDILSVLRLRDEFGLKVVLQHVSEGHLVAREIARANAPCSIIVLDSPGGKLEAVNVSRTCGGILERAGVNVALHTDDGITDSRLFLRTGAMAVRGGMSRDGALRALTLSGAEMLGLEKRIGSLEPGKDADFVMLSGDPFATKTRVLKTFVEGQMVFDFARPDDRLYAVGGPGAGTETRPYLCCQGGQH